MTFHCRNYDINKDTCKRLKGECVPGRRGCVLEGRVALSEELEKKIRELDGRDPKSPDRPEVEHPRKHCQQEENNS